MRLPKIPVVTRSSASRQVRITPKVDPWQTADEVAATGLAHQRTEILRHLARGEVRVSDLAEELSLACNDISYHLRALRTLGFVKFRREGRNLIYHLGASVVLLRQGPFIILRIGVSPTVEIQLCVLDTKTDLSPRPTTAPRAKVVVKPRRASVPAPPGRAR